MNSLFGYTPYNLIETETLWIATASKLTEVLVTRKQMRNIDTVSELSNGHRESKTNNDNSVIIVNLRTEGNRNLKGIISTVTSFHC